jgi:hypothetical protein
MRHLLQAAWPRGSGAMGCYGSQPIPKSYRVLARASVLVAITPIIKSERQPISAINFDPRNPARLCRHNATDHQVAGVISPLSKRTVRRLWCIRLFPAVSDGGYGKQCFSLDILYRRIDPSGKPHKRVRPVLRVPELINNVLFLGNRCVRSSD